MASIGSLFVDLGMNTARFEASVEKANGAVSRFEKKMNKQMKSMRSGVNNLGGQFAKLGTTLVAIAGPAAIGLLIKSSLDTVDALAKTSDKLGITTEKLAGLQHAGELTGVSTNTMNMALQRMTRRLAEAAQGTGEAKGALQELGLNAQQLSAMTPDQAFNKLADSMSGVSSQGDRVRLAMKLFDSEGVALVNTLALGSAGLDEMQKEAEALGIALTRADAAKIEAANDELTRAGKVFAGIGNKLAINLAPYIAAVANWFTKTAIESNGFTDTVLGGLTAIGKAIGFVADMFRGLHVVFKGLQAGFVFVFSGILSGLDQLSDGYIAFRQLFDSDYAPPVALQVLKQAAIESYQSFQDLSKEFSDLVTQPMPSENIAAWAEEIKLKADEVAQKIAATKAQMHGGAEGSAGFTMAQTDDQAAADLARLEEQLMSQQERINEALLNRQFIIENAYEAEQISLERRNALIQQSEAKHLDDMTKMREQAGWRGLAFDEMTMKAKMQMMGSLMGQMSGLMASENKKMFEIGKKAAIAEAIINTYQAISESLSAYPFPFNAVAAAAAGALGFMQVQKIKSTQFGSGSTGVSVGSGGVAVGTNYNGGAGNAPQAENPNTQQAQSPRSLTINVNPGITDANGIRELIGTIRDGLEDMGSNVIVQAGR